MYPVSSMKETYKESPVNRRRKTEYIDAIVTHKLFGFPIFLLFLFVTFFATFSLGSYPMEWIEAGVGALGEFVDNQMSAGPLKDLLVDGIIGGVGSVIVFLPNILILFLFISFNAPEIKPYFVSVITDSTFSPYIVSIRSTRSFTTFNNFSRE